MRVDINECYDYKEDVEKILEFSKNFTKPQRQSQKIHIINQLIIKTIYQKKVIRLLSLKRI